MPVKMAECFADVFNNV